MSDPVVIAGLSLLGSICYFIPEIFAHDVNDRSLKVFFISIALWNKLAVTFNLVVGLICMYDATQYHIRRAATKQTAGKKGSKST